MNVLNLPQVSYLLIYFTCDVHMTSLSRSWHWWAATASAACVARLWTVTDWWRSWPIANTLACLCSCQWWTFKHTLGLSVCFFVYLLNFTFHTTLDAVGSILRVHYKSMKCNVSFSQGSVSTLFRWDEHVFHVCVKESSSCLQQCKNYTNQTSFYRASYAKRGLGSRNSVRPSVCPSVTRVLCD